VGVWACRVGVWVCRVGVWVCRVGVWVCHVSSVSSMTDSTENATLLKSTKSRSSNFSAQIRMKPTSSFSFEFVREREREKIFIEFVPRDTEIFEFLRFGGFWGCGFFSGICHIVCREMA